MLISLMYLPMHGAALFGPNKIRHARITAQECTNNTKTSFDLVLTETAAGADRKHPVTAFTVEAKGGGKATVTITKDANGWPTNILTKGGDGEPDPLTTMLFLMREPLWSPKSGLSHWTASMFTPFDSMPKVAVACQLSPLPNGAKGVCLEQKTPAIPIVPGSTAQFTSKLVLDSIPGSAKTLQIKVTVTLGSKVGQLMVFDEKD